MDDKEYLYYLKAFKALRMDKKRWGELDDARRHDILEKMREVSEYSIYYRRNKKRNRYLDIDPYGEENWDE